MQQQSPLYMREGLDGPPTQLIDPNRLWPDGTTSLAAFLPSPDARSLAYTVAQGGADWQTISVRSLTTGQDLDDEVQWMRFSGLSWTQDGKGFFYSRYPEPPEGKVLGRRCRATRSITTRRHAPGAGSTGLTSNAANPTLVRHRRALTEDGRYLLIATSKGADNNNRLYVADLGDPQKAEHRRAASSRSDRRQTMRSVAGREQWCRSSFLRTDRDAPNRRIVAIDSGGRRRAWKTIVPEASSAIENVAAAPAAGSSSSTSKT